MKNLLQLIVLFISLSAISQIPAYYDGVPINYSGEALKNELAIKIISSHINNLSYTPDVWEALKQTDLNPNDPSQVLLIYGWNDMDTDITNDRSRYKHQNGGDYDDWNREHVYSKSLGNPNLGTSGAGSDAHNLRACDRSRNSLRSNRKFGIGNGIESYITEDGYWYPGDEWKGDVARMMMYMYLRYGNQCLPIDVGTGNTVSSDENMIELFLKWNAEDPVSDYELQRNPIIEELQGNRNPFIDNPAFATKIWGGPEAENRFDSINNNDKESPTIPLNVIALNTGKNSTNLTWSASTDNISVYGYKIYQNNILIKQTSSTTIFIDNLSENTEYTFTIKAYDTAGNTSEASNPITIKTKKSDPVNNGVTTELLISEYIEGSSYNKAIEISNFTGNTIDLSNYTIKKVTNGKGYWSKTLELTGILENEKTYVIANTNASNSLLDKADLQTTNRVFIFNGNDAIGLFKNDSLIDLLGDINSKAYFGKNKTLRRKPSIKSPNKNYLITEWDVYPNNDFSDVGKHNINNDIPIDTIAPSVPTNLIASDITNSSVTISWNPATDNIAVTEYEIYKNTTKVAVTTDTSYTFSNLDINTLYAFHIRAKDAANNFSDNSNCIFAHTKSDSLSYSSFNEKDFISIYPNPTTSFLNIHLNHNYNAIVYRIINNNGQVVMKGKTDKQIDVSNLRTGIYYIYIENSNLKLIKKIIKK